jgi:hypothetical protein
MLLDCRREDSNLHSLNGNQVLNLISPVIASAMQQRRIYVARLTFSRKCAENTLHPHSTRAASA